MQSLGKIVQRAPAVGAKMWCFLSRSESGVAYCAFEGRIVRTSIALPLIGRFRRSLQRFFQNGLLFQMHYIILIYVARWRHKIRKISVEILQSVNNRTQNLREILRMVIIDIVINTLLGRH